MKSTLRLAALAALVALSTAVPAQVLRWASQGDAQTMDPHSQNESLTNSINAQVYETLIQRGRKLELVPGLATEWTQTGPKSWRMALRRNVKFHDGAPFTADDVVFSIKRAQHASSPFQAYAAALGEPVRVDDYTVTFTLAQVNPIFLQHASLVYIMSRAWTEKNNAALPADFKNKEAKFTVTNMNGTGPFMLVSRQPDSKTVYRRNPTWWG